ncbi:glycine cleavage system protein GcvH [Natronospirillum operosum]|uniref:Glycine cleavage system H protein n=1 Tax=Natronospirillum operosum TaxID=2759953 RepID=A0A4Z0WCH7_9GAMM|nr:glycine cleavage system protein GcvH [Natronospirillum operosum]TGG92710.1 glycine cleavage system protein GcvH [Natronospirillum operosum]
MSNTPADLKYTATHEWLLIDGDIVTVGITDFAQEQLGDVVFVELPEVDAAVTAGDGIAVVESVKAASDIYAPATGTILAINESLEEAPELVNSDPFEDGWFFRMRVTDTGELDDLMDADSYIDHCADT